MPMIPRVHMNGTSRNELIEQHMAALRAVQAAQVALQNACPNGRDYYVIDNTATQRAMAEHMARLGKLTDVHKELETILEGIHGD